MAKYIVTNGDSISGPFDDEISATAVLITELTGRLVSGSTTKGWHIEEVPDEPEQPKDVPEMIPDLDAAIQYLGGGTIGIVEQSYAFRALLYICKAWNKADGWEPDWLCDPVNQKKYYPIFHANENKMDFSEARIAYSQPVSSFVFKTEERARQFGKQFIDLFRQLYGIKED